MKLWLRCVCVAQRAGPEFVGWVAKHALEIGGAFDEIRNFLVDLMDWVDACYPERKDPTIPFREPPPRGEQFVTRRFTPDMSLKTVIKLSHDWHEAVANNMSGPDCDFPEPWCPAGNSGGFEVVPITTSADLYREGYALHHCVGAYGSAVQYGHAYVYSVREGGERIATLSLQRYSNAPRSNNARTVQQTGIQKSRACGCKLAESADLIQASGIAGTKGARDR